MGLAMPYLPKWIKVKITCLGFVSWRRNQTCVNCDCGCQWMLLRWKIWVAFFDFVWMRTPPRPSPSYSPWRSLPRIPHLTNWSLSKGGFLWREELSFCWKKSLGHNFWSSPVNFSKQKLQKQYWSSWFQQLCNFSKTKVAAFKLHSEAFVS